MQTSERMAKPELLTSISALSKKVDLLFEQQKSLKEKIKNLESENEFLKSQHLADMSELQKAHKNIEFLSLSHRLAASPEALIEARNKISSFLRTIDSCIRSLKED